MKYLMLIMYTYNKCVLFVCFLPTKVIIINHRLRNMLIIAHK